MTDMTTTSIPTHTKTVFDMRGQHDARTYEIVSESSIAAGGEAVEKFIKDSGIKPRKPGTRGSTYYSRFYVVSGNGEQPEPNRSKVVKQGDSYLSKIRAGRMAPVTLVESLEKMAKGPDGRFQLAVAEYVKAGLAADKASA